MNPDSCGSNRHGKNAYSLTKERAFASRTVCEHPKPNARHKADTKTCKPYKDMQTCMRCFLYLDIAPARAKGLRATDVEGMRALGVSLPRVAALISEAFCEQVCRPQDDRCPRACGRAMSCAPSDADLVDSHCYIYLVLSIPFFGFVCPEMF